MAQIRERAIEPGSGWLVEVDAGQTLRLRAAGAVELYGYNRSDRAEWIDAARTRVYNLNVFPSSGHRLFSKQNNPLMRFTTDGFADLGKHDLQAGPARPEVVLAVLAPLGIAADDLPDPVSLCRELAIDQASGRITPHKWTLAHPVELAFEAETDMVCAVIAETGPVEAAVLSG